MRYAYVAVDGVDDTGAVARMPAQATGASPAKAWADAQVRRFVPAVMSGRQPVGKRRLSSERSTETRRGAPRRAEELVKV